MAHHAKHRLSNGEEGAVTVSELQTRQNLFENREFIMAIAMPAIDIHQFSDWSPEERALFQKPDVTVQEIAETLVK